MRRSIVQLPDQSGLHYRAVVSLSDTIRQARVARRWTQAELASEAGLSPRYVSSIENGQNVTVDVLQRVARALELESLELDGLHLMPPPSTSTRVAESPIELPDGLRVVEPNPRKIGMPIVAYVAAGHGGWEDASSDEVLMLPEYLLGADDFLVQAKGESMIDEGIEDGDYLIVERRGGAANVTHGDLIIAWLNDGLVIKRWYRRGGKKFLESANESRRTTSSTSRPSSGTSSSEHATTHSERRGVTSRPVLPQSSPLSQART
jgi:SOS-response transcriptional repressor LexA